MTDEPLAERSFGIISNPDGSLGVEIDGVVVEGKPANEVLNAFGDAFGHSVLEDLVQVHWEGSLENGCHP